MNLGDIKGAFLEADVKEQASINPVYSETPPRVEFQESRKVA